MRASSPPSGSHDPSQPDNRPPSSTHGVPSGRLCIEATSKQTYDRVIAITEEQLRKIPEVIVVGGGGSKTEAIRAVLRAGLVTSLVTDSGSARALLED